MTHSQNQGRVLSCAAGLVFLCGTCGILFEDVILNAAPFALKHVLTGVILAGTIMSGHLADGARRSRHWLGMLGFTAVFLAGTGLVVYNSAGRQAEHTIETGAQIAETNARRTEVLEAKARDERRLANEQDDLARECKSGAGKRCKGIQASIAVYQAAIKGHAADLEKLGPVRVSSPEAEQFAEVISVVFDADKGRVKAAAVLVAPFLVTLFLEFGTIVSFGYGFRHRPTVAGKKTIAETFSEADPEPLPPRPRKGKTFSGNVVRLPAKHPVVAALEKNGGTVSSNRELAKLMGCCDAEGTKRTQEVSHMLEIERVGKRKCMRLKAAYM